MVTVLCHISAEAPEVVVIFRRTIPRDYMDFLVSAYAVLYIAEQVKDPISICLTALL